MAITARSVKVNEMDVGQGVMLHCNKQLEKDHNLTKDLLKLRITCFGQKFHTQRRTGLI